MTDRQPEPTTEAGRGFYMDHFDYDNLPPSRMEYVKERILAIEAEARAGYVRREDCMSEAEEVKRRQDAMTEARADERERLAGAVPLLRHAAEYLSGEFGRTGKAEPNVLADRLQKLAAILPEAAPDADVLARLVAAINDEADLRLSDGTLAIGRAHAIEVIRAILAGELGRE